MDVSDEELAEKKKKDDDVRKNIQAICMYALSMACALGFNNLVTSIFNSLYDTAHVISKTTYVVSIFGLTLVVAHWLSATSTNSPISI